MEHIRREDITVREADAADHRNLLGFLMEAYPALGWSEAFMRWQYYENPAGNARSWVAVYGGNVIANYTAVPHRLWVKGRFTTGWRAQDVITNETFRGLGLYGLVSDAAVAALQRPDFPLNFTFPNENSHPGFMKRNWFNPNRIPLWSRQGIPEAPASTLSLQPVTQFGPAEGALWEAARSQVRFAIDRNPDYLNWRYFGNPRGGYFPFRFQHATGNGVLILKRFQRETGGCSAHLIDCFAQPGFSAWDQVLHAWFDFARHHGADFLSLWSPSPAPLSAHLPRYGLSLHADLTRWHVLNTNTPDPSLEEAADFRHWHFSMGDTDVY